MISPSQRPLPDNTQQSQQANIHAPGGIRTHNLSRRAAEDLRLRPRRHWDRHGVYLIRLKHRHLENLEVLLRFWTNSGNFGRNEQKGMIDVCVYLNYRQGYSWLYFEWERSDVTQYILLNAFFCCKITFIYYFYPYQRAQEWRFAVTSLTTKPVDFSGLTGTSFCEQVSRGPHFGFRNICLIGNRMIRKGLAGANLLLPEVTTSVLWCVAE